MPYLSLILLITAGLYTAWDSYRRGRSIFTSILWGVGVSVLFFVFFPLHLITRPRFNTGTRWNKRYNKDNTIDVTDEISIACSHCGQYFSGNPTTCPHCGTILKED
ncbi:MAG: hypothetical protein FH758_00915 [Firmicutes bacterium]|nr:hypothetical protein [Bacillota bacterium]